MKTLFGIPVDILMWLFVGLTALIVIGALISALRQPVLLRRHRLTSRQPDRRRNPSAPDEVSSADPIRH